MRSPNIRGHSGAGARLAATRIQLLPMCYLGAVDRTAYNWVCSRITPEALKPKHAPSALSADRHWSRQSVERWLIPIGGFSPNLKHFSHR